MYCSLRQYRAEAAKIDEMMHIADEQFADTLSEMPGFVDYHVLDCGNGEVFAWTLFRDKEAAERANDLAAEFVRDKLGAYEISRSGAWTGEVKVSRTRSEMLEPVHA